jgi:hypothetical protein
MQDIMGNIWTLEGGVVRVHPAQLPDGEEVEVEAPAGVVSLAPDFNGMVWCTTGGRELFRLNPRGPGYTDNGMMKRDTPGCEPTANVGTWSGDVNEHKVWVPFPADALPDGAIVSLAASVTSDRCAVTFDSGTVCEVELSAAGEVTVTSPRGAAAPQPLPKRSTTTVTHPDGTVVSVVTEEAAGPTWRMLPGLLPCGNHDIFAAGCNGKLYTTGGALWWCAGDPCCRS